MRHSLLPMRAFCARAPNGAITRRVITFTRASYTYDRKAGRSYMNGAYERRAVEVGEYIIEHDATVRAAAKRFGISKSTVHKDVAERLAAVSPSLFIQVREVLDRNKSERHIRGGEATRRKYLQMR